MKKRFLICLVLCLTLCLSVSASAFAEGRDQLSYVADTAWILTDSQCESLDRLAAEVSQQYGCGVYIVTMPDYTAYSRASVEQAAEAVYQSCNLGMGEERNGIMLFMSMAERDYDLCAYGSLGHYAFTDYGKNALSDCFLDNFRKNDWYGGFADYIRQAGTYLEYARQGAPIDVPAAAPVQRAPLTARLPLYAVISSLLSLLGCTGMKTKMKTAKEKSEASDYMGKVNLRVSQDNFINRTRSVQIVQSHRDSGGFGGGTSVNSGGFSHSSGKF